MTSRQTSNAGQAAGSQEKVTLKAPGTPGQGPRTERPKVRLAMPGRAPAPAAEPRNEMAQLAEQLGSGSESAKCLLRDVERHFEGKPAAERTRGAELAVALDLFRATPPGE